MFSSNFVCFFLSEFVDKDRNGKEWMKGNKKQGRRQETKVNKKWKAKEVERKKRGWKKMKLEE